MFVGGGGAVPGLDDGCPRCRPPAARRGSVVGVAAEELGSTEPLLPLWGLPIWEGL